MGIIAIAGLYLWVRRQDAGTERMRELARFIQEGANAFLRREFITIVPFVAVLAVLLFLAMPEGKWQQWSPWLKSMVVSMIQRHARPTSVADVDALSPDGDLRVTVWVRLLGLRVGAIRLLVRKVDRIWSGEGDVS